MLKLDIDKLCKAIDPSADLDFDYLGIQTLYDRYLVVDKTGEVARRLETPQFFGCVLRWVSLLMKKIQKSKSFLCTTYIKVDDSVHQPLHFLIRDSTFTTLFLLSLQGGRYYRVNHVPWDCRKCLLSKWAGGLGGSWTAVRGTGSHIAGTNGESQGVIPFLKMHNDQLCAVNQEVNEKARDVLT